VQDQDWTDFLSAFKPVEAKSGDVIMQQGDEGDLFYVVESGHLEVYVKAPGTIHPVKV
jgi:CRP-like cAMP-binding protein